ncbi:MAG: CoA pyrophosphatase [Deltaproteobacteria bacterium]|nr:CoA pyrophosphatase [Deltaproteobacteria bacterium]
MTEMDLRLLGQKDAFPLHVLRRLEATPLDYSEKHLSIVRSNAEGGRHLAAGVVVLLSYRNSEYVFQLIKRSETVAQAGDISCPGGMLERKTDEMLGHILLKTGIIRAADGRALDALPGRDEQTLGLVRLFLMNALREAWEEIGLSPLNVAYLGALPSYSLAYFARTIFPLVALVREPYSFQFSGEVEKVLEIPLRCFFERSSYALVEIESEPGSADPRYQVKFPGLVLPDGNGQNDILWGATFYIVTNFLKLVYPESFPDISPVRTVRRVLSPTYATGRRS